jgi:hypothetical protein
VRIRQKQKYKVARRTELNNIWFSATTSWLSSLRHLWCSQISVHTQGGRRLALENQLPPMRHLSNRGLLLSQSRTPKAWHRVKGPLSQLSRIELCIRAGVLPSRPSPAISRTNPNGKSKDTAQLFQAMILPHRRVVASLAFCIGNGAEGGLDYLAGVVCPATLEGNAFAGPTEASDSSSISSSFVLATLRETRGESKETQRGIFRSVLNREAKCGRWDSDAVSVGLKPSQLSCFNHGAHNLATPRGSYPVKTLFS